MSELEHSFSLFLSSHHHLPALPLIPCPSAHPSCLMSDTGDVKFSLVHILMLAAAFVLTGGGSIFIVVRRNTGRTGEADPEAVELVVTGTVDGDGDSNVTLGDAADASN